MKLDMDAVIEGAVLVLNWQEKTGILLFRNNPKQWLNLKRKCNPA